MILAQATEPRLVRERASAVGEDGVFKLLTWRSLAITRLFGLPDIVGEPIQQEFQFPLQRRVDRLFRLADGSLLNIEHQSTLADRGALARRMISYNVMIKEQFPKTALLQIVIYTGRRPHGGRGIEDRLEYASLDASGIHGVRFSAAMRNFRRVPTDEFLKSGRLDDLILGLMAGGGDDAAYIEEVVARIKAAPEPQKADAIEKFAAVCATMPDRRAGLPKSGEVKMWIDEVKDSPFVRQIVEIAGKDRMREEAKRTLAKLLVSHAVKLDLDLPHDAEALLMARASEEALFGMANDMENMDSFRGFAKRHGVDLSRSAS